MNKDFQHQNYYLIDSGEGRKLEKFGPYLIDRPCAQAVWNCTLSKNDWQQADVHFTREGESKWLKKKHLPDSWNTTIANIIFKISATDFGHLGVFPEQRDFWEWIQQTLKKTKEERPTLPLNILNLFAYSGGATLAAALAGAHVCHLDASKGMVSWARENALLNHLDKAPIRWIVDDVSKFLARELKRGVRYDGIILDPPSFGRGSRGEVFKIEENLAPILNDCRNLLTEYPLFILFSCHTPGFTPLVMHHLLLQMMQGYKGTIDSGEMTLKGNAGVLPLPSGVYARWIHG